MVGYCEEVGKREIVLERKKRSSWEGRERYLSYTKEKIGSGGGRRETSSI